MTASRPNWYERHLLPYLIDIACGMKPVRRQREKVVPLASKIAGGCRLDWDVPALLREAGFRSADMQTMYLPGPRPLTYNYWGTAVATS